jgi:hypothetical protein
VSAVIRIAVAALALYLPALAWCATVCKPGDSSARCAATATAPSALANVPAMSTAPTEAGQEKRYWDVRMDDRSIHNALARWGTLAKPRHQVVWEPSREFPIVASDSDNPFYGTFEEAVDRVLDSFATSDYPLKGCLYSNGVLRIVRRVDDGLECKR